MISGKSARRRSGEVGRRPVRKVNTTRLESASTRPDSRPRRKFQGRRRPKLYIELTLLSPSLDPLLSSSCSSSSPALLSLLFLPLAAPLLLRLPAALGFLLKLLLPPPPPPPAAPSLFLISLSTAPPATFRTGESTASGSNSPPTALELPPPSIPYQLEALESSSLSSEGPEVISTSGIPNVLLALPKEKDEGSNVD